MGCVKSLPKLHCISCVATNYIGLVNDLRNKLTKLHCISCVSAKFKLLETLHSIFN